ncbi:MAG TPA: hypothetical protein VM146_07895 [Steroidobacteraceae bacterium]|nr:hypothetical protein [Steroidobacteraceae bacterium]
MALRKLPDAEAAEDLVPLPAPTFATVLTVGDEPSTVTVAEPPAPAEHCGACTCAACRVTTLTDFAIRFSR